MKKQKQKFNKENVVLMLEMYIEALKKKQAGNKTATEEYAADVADLARTNKVQEADIMELQNHGIPPFVIMDVSSRLVVGPSGLTYHEAVELGHKYQFIALSYAQQTGGDVKQTLFNTINPMSEVIDEIHKGYYPKDKLKVLQDLPHISKWDHELGAKAYSTIYSLQEI